MTYCICRHYAVKAAKLTDCEYSDSRSYRVVVTISSYLQSITDHRSFHVSSNWSATETEVHIHTVSPFYIESSIETDPLAIEAAGSVSRLRWRTVISCCDCVNGYSTWLCAQTYVAFTVRLICDYRSFQLTLSLSQRKRLVRRCLIFTRWSLVSGVTRVGEWVTPGAATEGVTPLFFSWKTWRPFFAHRCHYHYRFLFLSLGCHPSRVSPHTFLPVRPRFSTILCKFAHKFFLFGCHPPGGCHPGRSAPPRTP